MKLWVAVSHGVGREANGGLDFFYLALCLIFIRTNSYYFPRRTVQLLLYN